MTSELDKNILRSAFFDNAEIHFVLFDKELNFIDVNEAVLKHYHLKRTELIGKNILQISPESEENGLYSKYKEVIRTGQSVVIEELITHPKFGSQHKRIKAFKVEEGLGAAISNITELKNTIEALEVFSYKSIHDMQAPISSILGITDIAVDAHDKETLLNYLNLVRQQATRIETITQQIINTLKIWREKNEPQLIDFKELIEEVKKTLLFVNGFNQISFEENIIMSQKFHGDKLLISSIFQNLIENSIKYRNQESPASFIKINVSESENFAKIVVEDNGMGIEKSLQKNIFKLFFRATDKVSGTGLGLYTIRYGIEKLGGHIKFESKEGQGTVFTIFIPNGKTFL